MENWQTGLVLSLVFCLTACSEKPAEKPRVTSPVPQASAAAGGAEVPAPASQPPAPASQPAAPVSPPATTVAAGPAATEKHLLVLHDFAKTPVIVTLNGEWVGQWDAPAEVPLSGVQRGKNDLLIEVAGEAKGQITLYVQAIRDNQRVNLLTLNFEGKPGKHAVSFGAK